ncbi:MAG: OmpA family protein [Chitinivibrionia bacterium]|nr:OmpA family protein [Chitinivibrionia bacterium]
MNARLTSIGTWTLRVALSAALAAGTYGCSSMSKTKKGAAIGAAAGTVVGAAIGSKSDNTGKGAVIGAAAGAITGGIIGHYMDKQAEELAQIEGATTERVGDEIKVTFQNAILFDFDSSVLKPSSQDQLNQMGAVFVKYPDTDIIIAGHTDSQGTEEYNQKLSERRAGAVMGYLIQQGINQGRLTTYGYGESTPVAGNDTEDGRTLNRRVELEIRANKELRERAAQEDQK